VSTMQEQARALGDPTRHSIFRHLLEADRPVGIAELTDRLKLNHNAIRQHLTKLVAADLVVEQRAAATGPGRPRLQYTVDPTAESRWDAIGPYERLAALLTETITSGEPPIEIGRREGRRDATQSTSQEPVDVLTESMARRGFDPTVQSRGAGADIILHHCPYASTAIAAPEVICRLHLGIAEGAAAAVGGVIVEELIAKDPRRAQCVLRIRTEDRAPTPGHTDFAH
jgi:predicted ArsR family transcriptional regulator